jgi:hypothetical protein
MSRGLGRGVIPQYHPLITASTRPLLRSLLASSGGDFVPAIRRYAGGLNLSVVYGLEATRDDDPALLKAEGATDLLANKITAGGGLWAVDILPCRPCLVTASTYPSADRTSQSGTCQHGFPAQVSYAKPLHGGRRSSTLLIFPSPCSKQEWYFCAIFSIYMCSSLMRPSLAECWHSTSFLLFHSITGIRPGDSSSCHRGI